MADLLASVAQYEAAPVLAGMVQDAFRLPLHPVGEEQRHAAETFGAGAIEVCYSHF